MPTTHLVKVKKQLKGRPGVLSVRANLYARITLLVFVVLALICTGLLFAEIATPGMAWYQYR